MALPALIYGAYRVGRLLVWGVPKLLRAAKWVGRKLVRAAVWVGRKLFEGARRLVNWVGSKIGKVWPTIANIREQGNRMLPTLEDEVTVEVTGQPGHSKQQLYFLALAAANGVVRQFSTLFGPESLLSPGYGMLMAEYDAADHWVRATIRYKWGMATAALAPRAVFGNGSIFDQLVVYRGPQCNVVGGNFDFTNVALPGIPSDTFGVEVPKLPFEGQTILTKCPTVPTPNPAAITQSPVQNRPLKNPGVPIPSPNPKPPGDNRSRGMVPVPGTGGSTGGAATTYNGGAPAAKCCDFAAALAPLVFAALSAPATNADMTFPVPVQGPTGG